MKSRVLLLLALLIVAPYAYSQKLAEVIRVDIPLNSTKDAAVKKLVSQGFKYDSSYESNGCKILKYSKHYVKYAAYYGYYDSEKQVSLCCSNGKVSRVMWDYFEDQDDIVSELRNVYDLEPYHEYERYGCHIYYFHWEKNTIIVGVSDILILSNTDAEKMYQKQLMEGSYITIDTEL